MTGRHTGSFFLKVGAALFCIGHIIHNGVTFTRQLIPLLTEDYLGEKNLYITVPQNRFAVPSHMEPTDRAVTHLVQNTFGPAEQVPKNKWGVIWSPQTNGPQDICSPAQIVPWTFGPREYIRTKCATALFCVGSNQEGAIFYQLVQLTWLQYLRIY